MLKFVVKRQFTGGMQVPAVCGSERLGLVG